MLNFLQFFAQPESTYTCFMINLWQNKPRRLPMELPEISHMAHIESNPRVIESHSPRQRPHPPLISCVTVLLALPLIRPRWPNLRQSHVCDFDRVSQMRSDGEQDLKAPNRVTSDQRQTDHDLTWQHSLLHSPLSSRPPVLTQ
jgi:hypothetical protein